MITFLTLLNTFTLIFILFIQGKFRFEIKKETTSFNDTLLGYNLILWKKTGEYSSHGVVSFFLPLKNVKKTELKEEIENLMNPNNPNRDYTLRAEFSWLKTLEEIKQFEKDYTVVNERLVKELVAKKLQELKS